MGGVQTQYWDTSSLNYSMYRYGTGIYSHRFFAFLDLHTFKFKVHSKEKGSYTTMVFVHRQHLVAVWGLLLVSTAVTTALIPFLDGGKSIPRLYEGYFDEQIAKQAASAVSRACAAGKRKVEVNFPPVPNLEEVRFGTPMNKKFGTEIIAKNLGIKGGYKPGSDVSRQLVGFSNLYWAKKIAPSIGGGLLGGKSVTVLSTEQVNFPQVQSKGGISKIAQLTSRMAEKGNKGDAVICVNPGGEETWDRLFSTHGSSSAPFVVLNNAYSTTYDVGNKRGYEEVYYLKRVSKGWVYRNFPSPWQAYLEKPDGGCELLQSYKTKPSLKEVATLVREESFRRYAMGNDRWMSGKL
jgi:hypothetical protein